MQELQVRNVCVSLPKPHPRNTRVHSKQQIRHVADSIEEFGFVNPVLLDEVDRIIAGHARLEAAKLLGLSTVPAIRLTHLSDHQKRALAIADNRLPEHAGWNEQLLAQELKILSEVEVNFEPTITGFSQAEIDLRIESLVPADDPEADEIPETEAPRGHRGPIWRPVSAWPAPPPLRRRDVFSLLRDVNVGRDSADGLHRSAL